MVYLAMFDSPPRDRGTGCETSEEVLQCYCEKCFSDCAVEVTVMVAMAVMEVGAL
jgi:hypothetical protein